MSIKPENIWIPKHQCMKVDYNVYEGDKWIRWNSYVYSQWYWEKAANMPQRTKWWGVKALGTMGGTGVKTEDISPYKGQLELQPHSPLCEAKQLPHPTPLGLLFSGESKIQTWDTSLW